MARKTGECIGKGTGHNPASHKHLRCMSCGRWAVPGEKCGHCGADPRALPVRLDEPTRKCGRCHIDQPLSYFVKGGTRSGADGMNPWCRPCRSEYVRQRREHVRKQVAAERRGIPDIWKKGQPQLSATMEAKVWRLLQAASDAASAGLWRGRPGIRAYRMLRIALDEWRAPESDRVLTGEEWPFEEAYP